MFSAISPSLSSSGVTFFALPFILAASPRAGTGTGTSAGCEAPACCVDIESVLDLRFFTVGVDFRAGFFLATGALAAFVDGFVGASASESSSPSSPEACRT